MTEALKSPVLGWGLLTAWGLVGMQLDIPIPIGIDLFSPLGILATCVSSVCLAAFVVARPFLEHKVQVSHHSNLNMWKTRVLRIGTVMMVASCLLNQLNLATQSLTWVQYATQITSSIGYVALILLWCHVYASMDSQKIENQAILSTAVCALVYLIAIITPPLVRAALWVILPAASAWRLSQCLAADAEVSSTDPCLLQREGSEHGLCATHGITLAHIPCGIGVLAGATASILPSSLTHLDLASSQPWYLGYAQLSGVVLAACLVLYCTVYARRISLPSFFKVLYPLAVGGLFLYCQDNNALMFAGMCLLYAAQWVLYVFIWLYAAERHPSGSNPIVVYALLRLFFDLGFVVSGVIGPVFGSSSIPVTLVCFGAAAVFVLTILLPLDTEVDIDRQSSDDVSGHIPDNDAKAVAPGRSERLAARYALSPRESEILSYLLRGYSLAAIRNELYIAKGTVDTYVQRIYRKCQVHSRQELINLADKKEQEV